MLGLLTSMGLAVDVKQARHASDCARHAQDMAEEQMRQYKAQCDAEEADQIIDVEMTEVAEIKQIGV